jgi:hypothetical protein
MPALFFFVVARAVQKGGKPLGGTMTHSGASHIHTHTHSQSFIACIFTSVFHQCLFAFLLGRRMKSSQLQLGSFTTYLLEVS